MISRHEKIIQTGVPDDRRLLRQGRAMASAIKVGRSAFLQAKGVVSEADYKQQKARKGETSWSMIMGLGSLDAQLEGLSYLHAFGARTQVNIDRGLVIPNVLTGLPPDLRADAPKGTRFLLENEADWKKIASAAPIQPCFNDFHIGSPNAVHNTINAVKAGCSYHGVLSQFAWDLPYWQDDVALVAENIKAIGIVSAKRDDHLVVYMGGKLNAVRKGANAPSDASGALNALGIVACDTIKDMIAHLIASVSAKEEPLPR